MNIYQELNIRQYINAYGTVTRYGGSIMAPEVLEAMREASRSYVNMDEFHQKAGEKISSLLGCEAAFVTSGAEAGIAVSTAAILAGTDIVKILALPDSSGLRNEVIIMKSHRSRYDQGIRVAGGKIVETGTTDLIYPEIIEAAIGEKTAFLFYLAEAAEERGSLPLKTLAAICGSANIPVVVDAAAELPPFRNFSRYLDEGADLVLFSGGKDIAGPQSSGLILGRMDLIQACRANCCPNHSIGRSMKVDKETLAGLVKAVELYAKTDFEKKRQDWEDAADFLFRALSKIKQIQAVKTCPVEPGIQPLSIPRVFLSPAQTASFTAGDLLKALEEGDPPVVAGIYRETLMLNPQNLRSGEPEIVAKRLIRILGGMK